MDSNPCRLLTEPLLFKSGKQLDLIPRLSDSGGVNLLGIYLIPLVTKVILRLFSIPFDTGLEIYVVVMVSCCVITLFCL